VGCGIRLVPRRMPSAHYRIPLLSRGLRLAAGPLAALGGSRTSASSLGRARLPHGCTSASSLGRAHPPTAATSQQAGCGYTHTATCDYVAAAPDGRHPPSVVATPTRLPVPSARQPPAAPPEGKPSAARSPTVLAGARLSLPDRASRSLFKHRGERLRDTKRRSLVAPTISYAAIECSCSSLVRPQRKNPAWEPR